MFYVRHWCSNISYNIIAIFKSFENICYGKLVWMQTFLPTEVRVMEFSMKALLSIANYFNKDDLPVDETLNAVFFLVFILH